MVKQKVKITPCIGLMWRSTIINDQVTVWLERTLNAALLAVIAFSLILTVAGIVKLFSGQPSNRTDGMRRLKKATMTLFVTLLAGLILNGLWPFESIDCSGEILF